MLWLVTWLVFDEPSGRTSSTFPYILVIVIVRRINVVHLYLPLNRFYYLYFRTMNPEQSHTISQVGDNTAPEPVSKNSDVGSLTTGYNMRCPAVKRLMREAAELANPENEYTAQPTETNLFEWHFTIKGPEGCEFENGVYHGRIIFPTEYPMKPPSFILLTPNGRFQTEEKICLSISNYHPETWLPSWSIRTALVALRSFMTTPGNEGAIGSLNFPPEERKKLAIKSRSWECHECGPIVKLLTDNKDAKEEGSSPNSDDVPTTARPQPSTVLPVKSHKKPCSETGVTKQNTHAKNPRGATVTLSTSSATIAHFHNENDTPERTVAEPTASASLLQQQQEPIKNIIYDFGIGCFVVLILALCLRRLYCLFYRL